MLSKQLPCELVFRFDLGKLQAQEGGIVSLVADGSSINIGQSAADIAEDLGLSLEEFGLFKHWGVYGVELIQVQKGRRSYQFVPPRNLRIDDREEFKRPAIMSVTYKLF